MNEVETTQIEEDDMIKRLDEGIKELREHNDDITQFFIDAGFIKITNEECGEFVCTLLFKKLYSKAIKQLNEPAYKISNFDTIIPNPKIPMTMLRLLGRKWKKLSNTMKKWVYYDLHSFCCNHIRRHSGCPNLPITMNPLFEAWEDPSFFKEA